MKPLVIALTKGRLETAALQLFEEAGLDLSFMHEKQRRLTFTSPDGLFQFILVKANDVVTYVKHGVADLGVVGKDTLIEHRYGYYEMLDLEIGTCRFCVASTPEYDPQSYRRKLIATKYPTVAAEHFRAQGQEVEIIKIEGSVELAPVLGLADAIVDIVETGSTLRENGLAIVEEICAISGRLIVNKAALKRKQERILPLLDQLQAIVGGKADGNI